MGHTVGANAADDADVADHLTSTVRQAVPPQSSCRETSLWLRREEPWLQCWNPCIRPLSDSHLEHIRLLSPHHRPPISQTAHPEPGTLCLTTLRYRRPDCYSICPSATYRLCEPYRPMSAAILDRRLSGHGRLHRDDQRHGSCDD